MHVCECSCQSERLKTVCECVCVCVTHPLVVNMCVMNPGLSSEGGLSQQAESNKEPPPLNVTGEETVHC